mgnify:CR=1 FL=1
MKKIVKVTVAIFMLIALTVNAYAQHPNIQGLLKQEQQLLKLLILTI